MVDWQLLSGESGLGVPYADEGASFRLGAVFADRFFIAGAHTDAAYSEIPGIWSSSNGRTWALADIPDLGFVSDLVVGPGALLAVGNSTPEGTPLWVTANGEDWIEAVETDFVGQRVSRVGATRDGFVALGTSVWTSADGLAWQIVASDSATALAQAGVQRFVRRGDQLLAISGGSSSTGAPVEVWSSTDLTTWAKVAELPHSRNARHLVFAEGPLGLIVAGDNDDQAVLRTYMWISADGVTWNEVASAPGPVSDAFVDATGFIAVGFIGISTGCATFEGEIQGFTWTSLDGQTWARMPLDDFKFARIDQLFRDGRTLFGVGARYEENVDLETAIGAIWTARLPQVVPVGPAPTAAPTATPEPGGCG